MSRAAAIARSSPGPALRRLAGARLATIRRKREIEAAVDEGGPDPLPRLAHSRVGKADHRESGQAAMDIDLDPDRAGGDAVEGEGLRRGEHGNHAREPNPTRGALNVPELKTLWSERRFAGGEGEFRSYGRCR